VVVRAIVGNFSASTFAVTTVVQDGNRMCFRATFHRIRIPVPLIAILRVLGADNDEEIMHMIIQDPNDGEMRQLLIGTFEDAARDGIHTKDDAIVLVHRFVQQQQMDSLEGNVTSAAAFTRRTNNTEALKPSNVSDLNRFDLSYVFKLFQLHCLPHALVAFVARPTPLHHIHSYPSS
jgi:DNA-directed RNA polymerase beta subunit